MYNPIEEKRKIVKERIEKSFNNGINVDELLNDIEKARKGVYADNALNRKLMRVGRQYGSTKNVFRPGTLVRAKLPTGKIIEAVYDEPYGSDFHSVKFNGKSYGVKTENIEKIKGQYSGRKPSREQIDKLYDKVQDLKEQYFQLKREYKQTQIDMEEELAAAGESVINNGNHPLVVHYGKELERIDNKMRNVKEKYDKAKSKLDEYYV